MPPNQLVVATRNIGKLAEFKRLLGNLPYQLTSLAELNIASPAETGSSFAANALLKAQHAANLTGSAAIADDSGLEVDALQGAPGIFSARYAGPQADRHLDVDFGALLDADHLGRVALGIAAPAMEGEFRGMQAQVAHLEGTARLVLFHRTLSARESDVFLRDPVGAL